GVQVGQAPQRSKVAVDAPRQDAALPFRYFYVKESGTPEYHRPPSRNEQRAARAFAERYRALLVEDEAKARAFLQRWADAEPPPPAVVRRVLDRGFYVAGVRTEVRASRRFLRTLKGTYIKMAKLEERHGSDFHGIELGEALSLPLAFAVRAARPMIKRERADGSIRFRRDSEAAAIARHAVVEGWLRRERIGAHKMHVLSGDRYLHDWFVAVAEARKPPKVVGPDEVWIHVDRANQVLVLYEGKTPRFVTLVSTGLPEHETPVGRFRIRKKFISDTMSALGPDAGDDRYRIEDVPWTQYFSGAIALHGAFWHDRFGLQRSHGCVNLAPRDAHTIFNFTQPELVDGWHGRALPPRRQAKGTLVWVTE
ncbi:MAG: L,D-transpeptidase, partial [Polyangiales bacterium]